MRYQFKIFGEHGECVYTSTSIYPNLEDAKDMARDFAQLPDANSANIYNLREYGQLTLSHRMKNKSADWEKMRC